MPRPLSMDLRLRLVEAVLSGASRNSVARRFGVAPSSVIKIMQVYDATGDFAPKRMGGHRKPILAAHERLVSRLLAARPDATLDELTGELNKRKVAVGRSSVNRFLGRLRISFKKNIARQ